MEKKLCNEIEEPTLADVKKMTLEGTFYSKSESGLWIKEANGFVRSINIAST
jgi:hypothetical protein